MFGIAKTLSLSLDQHFRTFVYESKIVRCRKLGQAQAHVTLGARFCVLRLEDFWIAPSHAPWPSPRRRSSRHRSRSGLSGPGSGRPGPEAGMRLSSMASRAMLPCILNSNRYGKQNSLARRNLSDSMSLLVLALLAPPGGGSGGAEAPPPRVRAHGAALERACCRRCAA